MTNSDDHNSNSLNSQGNSQDPTEGTPVQKDSRVGIYNRFREIKMFDGTIFPKSRSTVTTDDNGNSYEHETEYQRPTHKCSNPFDLHVEPVWGILDDEIFLTEAGTPLCKDCLEINKKRADWQDALGTLFYWRKVY